MHIRHIIGVAAVLCLASITLPAQSPKNNPPADSGGVIRTETKLVLVDAVVTDKKGNYIRDLTAKDFRVWEDKAEQTIKSFSLESDPASGAQKQYLVFFFDVTSMSASDQALARQAAAEFRTRNRYEQGLRQMIAAGIRSGEFFAADAALAARVILGALNSTVLWFNPQGPLSAGSVAENFADYLIRGLSRRARSLRSGRNGRALQKQGISSGAKAETKGGSSW